MVPIHVSREIDFDAVVQEIAGGYISERKHPDADLRIYNYTPRAQYERRWNAATMNCRGLVVGSNRQIIARPFQKFFNYDELDGQAPVEPFEVYAKVDGCLAILYWIGNEPYLTTRGSFTSEQAAEANRIFRQRGYDKLNFYKGWTYLFELISPKFRIVVDYGDMEDLILLAILDTRTGKDIPIVPHAGPIPTVEKYDFTDIDSILATQKDDEEGFVIRFESGLRCKIKFEEYKRLHKILTQVSTKSIWESLRDGKPLDEILERVPDEFFSWVRETKRGLELKYADMEAAARVIFDQRPATDDRGDVARYFLGTKFPQPSVLFNMLDGKDYAPTIWKSLRPKFEKPFRMDIDDA